MSSETEHSNADRPYIPGYDIPKSTDGLLPWSYVQERMLNAINYWISTSNTKCQPHATPVWGVWVDDVFYFDGGPKTRRSRDIAVNPQVSVHLEDGTRAIILEGTAKECINLPLELGKKLSAEYIRKYSEKGYSPEPDSWKSGGLYAFRASRVFAWTVFPKDTTRWQIEE